MTTSMTKLRPISVCLALVSCLVTAATFADTLQSGEWTVREVGNAGRVQFSLSSPGSPTGGHGRFNFSSTIPLSMLSGLELSPSERRDVRFEISRDAGRFVCEGFVKGGRGAGTFDFVPNPEYAPRMESLGFAVDERNLIGMALHDVSLDFAEGMRNADLSNLDTDKLVAFRVHGVTETYIAELRSSGQEIVDSDDLVAFRIHGASPELVRELHRIGYEPENDDIVALRVHGASIQWIEELARRGYDRAKLNDLIAFRIHGVSPEFIDKIEALGYPQPKPADLIAMRIHGVTPAFISDLHARGLDHLSIDQLVGMRIHGLK